MSRYLSSEIDYEKAESEIMRAVESGVNYFDTAYAYGGSEECLGRILEENKVRDKVKTEKSDGRSGS